ncbi:hypothetical protein J6590_077227 [Homalodisca vitripennis]|nr:hypothetical protein J6590_077227 [Homalodisca vitripennis]
MSDELSFKDFHSSSLILRIQEYNFFDRSTLLTVYKLDRKKISKSIKEPGISSTGYKHFLCKLASKLALLKWLQGFKAGLQRTLVAERSVLCNRQLCSVLTRARVLSRDEFSEYCRRSIRRDGCKLLTEEQTKQDKPLMNETRREEEGVSIFHKAYFIR